MCAVQRIGAQLGTMVAQKLKEAIKSKCSVIEAEEVLLDLQSPMSDSLGMCCIVLYCMSWHEHRCYPT